MFCVDSFGNTSSWRADIKTDYQVLPYRSLCRLLRLMSGFLLPKRVHSSCQNKKKTALSTTFHSSSRHLNHIRRCHHGDLKYIYTEDRFVPRLTADCQPVRVSGLTDRLIYIITPRGRESSTGVLSMQVVEDPPLFEIFIPTIATLSMYHGDSHASAN